MNKKILSFILVVVMIMGMTTVVSAEMNLRNINSLGNDTEKEGLSDNTQIIEIDIIEVDANATTAEKYVVINEYRKNQPKPLGDAGVALMYVTRSGNTSGCDIIFSWAGYEINCFRFKQMEFMSTSILYPQRYDYIGDGVTYTENYFSMSTALSQELGRVNIPTDVSKIKIVYNTAQVFATVSPIGWYSVSFLGKTVDVD